MAISTGVVPHADPRVEGILYGLAWEGVLTFGFPDAAGDFGPAYGHGEPLLGFRSASAALEAAIDGILLGSTGQGAGRTDFAAGVAQFTALEIQRAEAGEADIRVAQSSRPPTAWAYRPGPDEGGDVWLGRKYSGTFHDYQAPILGAYSHLTLMHEIGHALGLKHAHEAGPINNGVVPPADDAIEFTVMSYRSFPGSGSTGYVFERFGAPQSFMMLDMAALQYLYGANFAHNAGDTVYSWSPVDGAMSIDGVRQATPGANRIFATIWDGNGNDTYDLSNYAASVAVDLRPGRSSVLSHGQLAVVGPGGTRAGGNVYNALQYAGDTRSLIENAIAGPGDDLLEGNDTGNHLAGGAGADTLAGGAGDDALAGGAGTDTAVFAGRRADFAVAYVTPDSAGDGFVVSDARAGGGQGADTVSGVEFFAFDDVLLAAEEVLNPAANRPTAGGDSLFGGARADRIDALAGDDTVNAGGGDDTVAGGAGNDVLDGGAGFDTAAMGDAGFRGALPRPAGAGLVVTTAAGADTLANIEVATFADGRLVLNAADPAARVARLYEAALDRLPDQGGLNFWIGAVQNGEPLSSLASGFLSAPEFRARFGDFADNGAFVDRLYLNVLGRAGEAEGRAFWVDTLNSGAATRADVLAAFSESAENQAGTAALVQNGIWDRSEAAAQVARLYDTVFGRLPDAPGLVAWKGALEGGGATLAQVADAFAGSAEFQAKYGALGNRGFADALYANTLDRPADQAGLDYWTGQLDAGVARSAVVLAFSESAEHVNLTANAIQSEDPDQFGILFA